MTKLILAVLVSTMMGCATTITAPEFKSPIKKITPPMEFSF
jgi:hypothetical protein